MRGRKQHHADDLFATLESALAAVPAAEAGLGHSQVWELLIAHMHDESAFITYKRGFRGPFLGGRLLPQGGALGEGRLQH
eukprot:scaffold61756_cov18-Tisochrysis_lutea.AAC.1